MHWIAHLTPAAFVMWLGAAASAVAVIGALVKVVKAVVSKARRLRRERAQVESKPAELAESEERFVLPDHAGIVVDNMPGIKVERNSVYGFDQGIVMSRSPDASLMDNRVYAVDENQPGAEDGAPVPPAGPPARSVEGRP